MHSQLVLISGRGCFTLLRVIEFCVVAINVKCLYGLLCVVQTGALDLLKCSMHVLIFSSSIY